jgi:multidrug transporter EmrE-like cation transporter
VTFYFRSVADRRAWSASGVSVFLSLLDILVLAKVIIERSVPLAVAYALGEGLGTWTVMTFRRRK